MKGLGCLLMLGAFVLWVFFLIVELIGLWIGDTIGRIEDRIRGVKR